MAQPGHRQCALASVTSFSYTGDRITGVSYAEPRIPRADAGCLTAGRPAVTRASPIGHNGARYYSL